MPNTSTTPSSDLLTDQDKLSRFIDPYSHFGFKFLFGKEPNKEFLIRFLNGIFNGRKFTL
jgi:hypothetical protein